FLQVSWRPLSFQWYMRSEAVVPVQRSGLILVAWTFVMALFAWVVRVRWAGQRTAVPGVAWTFMVALLAWVARVRWAGQRTAVPGQLLFGGGDVDRRNLVRHLITAVVVVLALSGLVTGMLDALILFIAAVAAPLAAPPLRRVLRLEAVITRLPYAVRFLLAFGATY